MASWIRALVAAAVAAVAAVVAVLPTSALASADSYAYETRPHVYDAPAQLSMKRAASVAARDSPTRPAVVSWGWSVAAGESVLAANNARSTAARSVDDVLSALPRGNQSSVRVVPDQATLRSTFADLTRGGTPATWKNYSGQVFEMSDGAQIGLRPTSSSGHPTIDIHIPGQDPFKIHTG